MENSIQIQNAEEYENRGNKAVAAVQALEVVDEATNAQMGDLLSKVKQGMRVIESKIEEPIQQANQLHRWLTGIRGKVLAPWKTAEAVAKQRMGDFQYKLMVERREAQAKADAERARLEEEQARKAQAAMEANKPKQAAKILEKPIETKTIVPEAVKTEKQTSVFTYDWEPTDLNRIPKQYWKLDEAMIGAQVKKEKLECKIPGIKIIESAGIRSR